jgi:hypothetical protein
MSGFSGFWAAGGLWMYVVLLLSLLGLGAGVAQLILARVVDLRGVVIGAAALPLCAGLLGTLAGWIRGFGAVAMVAPEDKGTLMAVALAEGLCPTILACGFGVLIALLAGVALTLRANLSR